MPRTLSLTLALALALALALPRTLTLTMTRYSITHAREADGLSAALLHEIDLLQADAEIETTLLVHPHVFADDFVAFTRYTQNAEAWMRDEGLVDELLP